MWVLSINVGSEEIKLRRIFVRKLLKILGEILGFIIAVILVVVIAFQVSPRPGGFLISQMFNQDIEITDENRFEAGKELITSEKDLKYQSDYGKSNYDLFYPKNIDKKLPIVFWVHGGGYLGGDKTGVEEFATYLANDAQVAVVAVNYEWAPTLKYPGQVEQINQAYQSIKAQQADHPNLDFNQLIFGGDSAGAQIAGQYVAIQANPSYAKQMEMKQVVPTNQLKGFVSYSGPVDLKEIKQQSSSDRFMKFFVHTVAWSLLGRKDWKESPELEEASLVDKITSDFPATFITDGNAFSFQEQGINFANGLQKAGVPVESLFYKDSEKEITHEYQFNFSMPEAQDCYQKTLNFINEQMLDRS